MPIRHGDVVDFTQAGQSLWTRVDNVVFGRKPWYVGVAIVCKVRLVLDVPARNGQNRSRLTFVLAGICWPIKLFRFMLLLLDIVCLELLSVLGHHMPRPMAHSWLSWAAVVILLLIQAQCAAPGKSSTPLRASHASFWLQRRDEGCDTSPIAGRSGPASSKPASLAGLHRSSDSCPPTSEMIPSGASSIVTAEQVDAAGALAKRARLERPRGPLVSSPQARERRQLFLAELQRELHAAQATVVRALEAPPHRVSQLLARAGWRSHDLSGRMVSLVLQQPRVSLRADTRKMLQNWLRLRTEIAEARRQIGTLELHANGDVDAATGEWAGRRVPAGRTGGSVRHDPSPAISSSAFP